MNSAPDADAPELHAMRVPSDYSPLVAEWEAAQGAIGGICALKWSK